MEIYIYIVELPQNLMDSSGVTIMTRFRNRGTIFKIEWKEATKIKLWCDGENRDTTLR